MVDCCRLNARTWCRRRGGGSADETMRDGGYSETIFVRLFGFFFSKSGTAARSPALASNKIKTRRSRYDFVHVVVADTSELSPEPRARRPLYERIHYCCTIRPRNDIISRTPTWTCDDVQPVDKVDRTTRPICNDLLNDVFARLLFRRRNGGNAARKSRRVRASSPVT